MAELADAPDLGSGGRKALGVRLPPFALLRSPSRELRRAACGCEASIRLRRVRRAEAAQPRRRTVQRVGITAMKTEFVDVNETRKNVRVEIPTDVVDAEIDRVATRLLAQGAHPRLPPGQGAAARHQAALQGSDPPRRRARPDPARGRRRAAREGARGGRHAGRARRDDRRRPAADLHRVVRHGAGVRSRRPRRDRAPTRASNAINDEAVDGALQRLRDRGARHEPVEGRGVDHGDTVDARSRAPRRRRRARHAQGRQHRARRQGEPARLRRAAARPRSRRHQGIHIHYPPTTRLGSSPTPTSRIQ